MVFDEEFIAGLPEPNPYDNSQVVELCKFPYLKDHREQIESWFLNVPESEHADLKARLRSRDDGQHMGAFYELVLHQFCLEEGWDTSLHHLTDDGLTPDLKIVTMAKQEFLLEAYTQQDDAEFRKQQAVMNKLNDAISKLKTPYILSLHYQSNPPLNTEVKAVAADVQGWLNSLQPDAAEEFQYELGHRGLELRIDARIEEGLKLKGGGCVIAIIGPGTSGLPGTSKVSNKLQTKRKKYSSSKTKLPLVVAVCDGTSQSWWGPDTVDRALFGWPVITFSVDGSAEAPQAGRDNSGLVTPKQFEDGYLARNRGISAVLYCARKQEGPGKIQYQMLVYHNPWAYVPLPEDIFEKMPQLVVIKNDETGLALEWNMENWEHQRIFFT